MFYPVPRRAKEIKMKYPKYSTRSNPSNVGLVALLAAGLMFGVAHNAMAAGIASGTTISNSATLSFTVGGVSQTSITSSAATFLVDNKVNLTVAKVSDLTVTPGTNNQALRFTVTNTGNTSQRYLLTAVAGTENLDNDMTSVRIFRDSGSVTGSHDGTDTEYVNAGTFGDIAADGTLNVLIVANMPLSQTNSTTAIFHLVATTVAAGGTTTALTATSTSTADTAGTVDVVFADSAGSEPLSADAARDGKHSELATYTVSTSSLTITKTSVVHSDPVSSTTNPKRIFGAVVTYTITITNASGGAQATSVSISDSLNTEIATNLSLTFRAQFNDGVTTTCGSTEGIVIDADGSGSGAAVCKTNASGDDTTTFADFTSNVVNASGLTIDGGTNATIKFQVVVR